MPDTTPTTDRVNDHVNDGLYEARTAIAKLVDLYFDNVPVDVLEREQLAECIHEGLSDEFDRLYRIEAAHEARQVCGTTDQQPAPTSSSTKTSYRLEHRQTGSSDWQPDTPGIGARWSWVSRTTADQRLCEARDRWPDYEHRLITITTTVAEVPTDRQPVTAPAGTELRDRVAQALAEYDLPYFSRERRAAVAAAVLAVLPAPTDRAAALSPTERTMMTFALNQAQLRVWAHPEKHTEEDQAALVSLRRLVYEQPVADVLPEFELRGDTEIRAAVLREAASSVESSDVTYNTEAVTAALTNGGPFALIAFVQLAIGAHLRHLADEAQQPEITPAEGEAADAYARAVNTPPSAATGEAMRERLESGTAPRRRVRILADEAQQEPTDEDVIKAHEFLRTLVAGTDEAQQPETEAASDADRIVAYRDPKNPHVLLCRTHGEQWQGVIPVTSEDLPDGGFCTFGRLSSLSCDRDVLAEPAP